MKKILMILVSLMLVMLVSVSMAEGAVASIDYSPAIDLTPLFQAVIAFLTALVSYKLIPWIQARTTALRRTWVVRREGRRDGGLAPPDAGLPRGDGPAALWVTAL